MLLYKYNKGELEMKKKKRKEKTSKILLAIFIVVASYTLVLNVSRIYNMYSKIEIEVTNYKELEEQLSILKKNVDEINNLEEGYYDEKELTKIKDYFKDSYNRYSNSILLKNRSGKYTYAELLQILELDNYSLGRNFVAEKNIFKEKDKYEEYFLNRRMNGSLSNGILVSILTNDISNSSFEFKGNIITARSYNFDHIFLKELENINMLADIALEKGGAQ